MDATTIITQIFLPVSLAIIMFGMGLTLVINDFTRLFTYPKEIFIGLFNQLVFLPLIGFLIFLSMIIEKWTTERALTSRRLIVKVGLISSLDRGNQLQPH